MRQIFLYLGALLASGTVFSATTNPGFLKLKIYKVAISSSPLCTNPITVLSEEGPTYTDFLTSPSIGSGSVADGNYPCVIIEFSDNIQFTSSTSTGNCATATTYTSDVCGASFGGAFTLLDGTTGTCGATEQRVAMYLSTASTGGSGSANAFLAPTSIGDTARGFNLGAALIVSGSSSAKFIVNASNKIDGADESGLCAMQAPAFSFSKIE